MVESFKARLFNAKRILHCVVSLVVDESISRRRAMQPAFAKFI
jgi:hypothetical protein